MLARVLYFLTFSFLFCRLLEFVNTFSSCNVVFLSKLVVVFNSLLSILKYENKECFHYNLEKKEIIIWNRECFGSGHCHIF